MRAFSFLPAALALLAADTVFSRPTGRKAGAGCSKGVAALYFIDNNPAGNNVIASDIRANGDLSFRGALSTGGKGGVGVDENNTAVAADALFGQGAVAVDGNLLFAVNAGDNTVSMFTINPNDPADVKLAGKPAPSGGDFPMSVAVSKKRNMACVLNGGAKSGVRCFTPTSCGPVPIAGSDREIALGQSTPPSGPANTMSHILFDQTGDNLLVSVKGTPPDKSGNLASFAIDANGNLAAQPVLSKPRGLLPFGMALIPGTSSVMVTDPGVGVVVFDMAKGGAASSVPTAITGQKATCWAARSPRTKDFYVTDIESNTVVELSVAADAKSAKVEKITQLGNGSKPIDIAVASPAAGQDLAFVNNPGNQTIIRFALEGKGKMKRLADFDVKSDAAKMGVQLGGTSMGMVVKLR